MNTDSTALVAVTATSLLVGALLYVWTAIALSALFRKSGEAGWKGWVPVYNVGVLFQLAGYPWWSVLLFLIPIAGPVIVFVVFVLAALRVNRAFGFGGGMTVLAVLLPPVWATVLGFGSARWIGAEKADSAPRRRTHGDVADPVYARGFDGTPESFGAVAEPAAGGDGPVAAGLAGWAPTRADGPRADEPRTDEPRTDEPRPDEPRGVEPRTERPSGEGTRDATAARPAPTSPFADWWPDVLDEDPDTDSAVDDPVSGPLFDEGPPQPVAAADADPPTPSTPRASAEPATAEPATASPVSASPSTAHPGPADLPPLAASAAEESEEVPPPLRRSTARPSWNGFDLSAPGEFTGEVTDAVPGAPAPISAVPAATDAPSAGTGDAAGSDDRGPHADLPAAPAHAPTPPVTRAPVVAPGAPSDTEADAFPDDGGVSAIVGAPVAGSPRSARSSVSARFADVSRDEELDDHTIVTRRRRTGWILVGPDGERIALEEDVAVVGRRPSVDAAFPHAQLVTLGDPTRTVSKTHARLELRGDVWTVVDLDSTNGVVLIADNDDETEVQPGAVTRLTPRFLLGDAELRLEELPAP